MEMSMSNGNVLNKIFSRRTLRDVLESRTSISYEGAVRKNIDFPESKKNIDLIRELYKKIKKNYRNEYFYKNTLLNKLLLGVHKITTTTALTEISVAKSKADFVLINGKAVVYEIKTELDNFDRLKQQIHDYYKAFDHVAVVIWDDKSLILALNKILDKLEYPVGVYVLRKNGCLGTVKKPEPFANSLAFEAMFKLLRKSEYEQLILKFYGELPQTSQFEYYKTCKKMLSLIDIDLFYSEYLMILKTRAKVKKDFLTKVPYELKFLAYFMNMCEDDYVKLDVFLNKPYGGIL